jgi:starch synthase
MRVVFCAAEVAPFSQAGGLGDVAGSLPAAIAGLGAGRDVQCIVVTPLYNLIDRQAYGLEQSEIAFDIHLGGKNYSIAIWQGRLPNSDVPVYFVENARLFSRDQVYPYGQPEWELEGFLVFNQVVFELLRRLHYRPDILHVHDWHTASIATTLSDIRAFDQYFSRTFSVLTIHNLSYQGIYGDTNCLRDGILKADAVTTVSPTYAREIRTPRFGAGLEGVIRECGRKVSGILNGIDTTVYNPATDTLIPARYDDTTFEEGKRACKAALQRELNLPVQPDAPLIGFVGRFVEQKGLNILLPLLQSAGFENERFQWALLGSGDPGWERTLSELSAASPRVRVQLGFNPAMARKIYAASDLFVMPSAFEPCGLGQMIALRYGSVPVVHAVGGLADTIVDVRADASLGNGFRFDEYHTDAFRDTLLAAARSCEDPAFRANLIRRGMREDHSWRSRAEEYASLYTRVLRGVIV